MVLDPRTRMILYKFLSKNVISEINGCISTGRLLAVMQLIVMFNVSKTLECSRIFSKGMDCTGKQILAGHLRRCEPWAEMIILPIFQLRCSRGFIDIPDLSIISKIVIYI